MTRNATAAVGLCSIGRLEETRLELGSRFALIDQLVVQVQGEIAGPDRPDLLPPYRDTDHRPGSRPPSIRRYVEQFAAQVGVTR